MEKLVSVCIAAYNAAEFIEETLDSLREQRFKKWELIVVEDGSNDGTESIVEKFSKDNPSQKVVYENLGTNQGVSATRNRLLSLAQGEIITFLDADDIWKPTHLRSIHDCLEHGYSLVMTPIELFSDNRARIHQRYQPTKEQLAKPLHHLFEASFIQTSSCVALNRTTIDQVGQFDTSLRIGEDRDYWFRVLSNGGSIACTSEPTCCYRKHSNSAMSKTMLVAHDTESFYRKHFKSESIPIARRKAKLSCALSDHGRLLRKEQPLLAREKFFEAFKLRPQNPMHLVRGICTGLR